MKREQMLFIIKDLAKSQGFYGRLLEVIEDAPESELNEFWENLEQQHFKDVLDFVMYLEN